MNKKIYAGFLLAMMLVIVGVHATLQNTERGVLFQSTNGTQYNGEPDRSAPIKFVYNIANFQMSYQWGGDLFGFSTSHYGLNRNGGTQWLSTGWHWTGAAHDYSSVSRINEVQGTYTIKAKNVSITNMTGTGDAYVCVHADGTLYRSVTPCVPVTVSPYGSSRVNSK